MKSENGPRVGLREVSSRPAIQRIGHYGPTSTSSSVKGACAAYQKVLARLEAARKVGAVTGEPDRVLVAEPLVGDGGSAVLSAAGLGGRRQDGPSREQLPRGDRRLDALVVRSANEGRPGAPDGGGSGPPGRGPRRRRARQRRREAATERGNPRRQRPSGNVVSAAASTRRASFFTAPEDSEARSRSKGGAPGGEKKKKKGLEGRSSSGTSCRGKTVGLVGVGQVGARGRRPPPGWQVTLLAYDPYVTPERASEMGGHPVSLEELLAKSDVVSLTRR